MKAWTIVLLGLVFHSVYLFSIVDIYFRSPLVHGMEAHQPRSMPLADRLVLFVADGLRADKVFEVESTDGPSGVGSTRAPFLHTMALKHGRWGVSHAHIPTESRPGHVALIGGFYEDVSAVTKGWKANPVEFDHLFNQSRRTYGWGSPDIVPMFSDNTEHMIGESYAPELEDFGNEGSHLDTWVFEKMLALFEKAEEDEGLRRELLEPQTVFFFHLLGLDSNGHAHRPYSEEYLHNVHVVDSGIEQAYNIIEDFYDHDGRTAYVFTADHGMSNKGNHGDGHPHNTHTPLIAWGAGIAKAGLAGSAPDVVMNAGQMPSDDWFIAKERSRHDVDQADVAPLMAALLGVPFPRNSVGVLPVEYLECEGSDRAELLYTNAKQVFAQLERKSLLTKESALFFAPFPRMEEINDLLRFVEELIGSDQPMTAVPYAKEAIAITLEGMHYFQTYDWTFLMTVITLGFSGWICLCLVFVYSNYGDHRAVVGEKMWRGSMTAAVAVGVLTFGALAAKLLLEGAPVLYYAYCAFPVLFWTETLVLLFRSSDVTLKGDPNNGAAGDWVRGAVQALFLLILIEVFVYCFFERRVLAACLLGMAAWAVMGCGKGLVRYAFGAVSCLMAVFPLLSPEVEDHLGLVCLGTAATAVMPLVRCGIEKRTPSLREWAQSLTLGLTLWLVWYTTKRLEIGDGLSPFLQALNILLSSSCFFVPWLAMERRPLERLQSISLAVAVPYVLLSIHYEMLYFTLLLVLSYCWWHLELQCTPSEQRGFGLLPGFSFRTAAFFTVMFFLAFFGTGNIASISSFDISSCYRFITVFSPFTMTFLLLFKTLIPFAVVSVVFLAINRQRGVETYGMILTVIAMFDVMAVNFFFLVKDTGSWKEIGVTISHYIVSSLFIVILLGLFIYSSLYLIGTHFPCRRSKME